ncbi:hypothetical protein BU064_00185 [Staphylococcus succinus]|nr:hypothetical protein BU064_00185 [Staphylococcus succinus]
MAYEYEEENIRTVRSINILAGSSDISKPTDELKEVYRKAKAFDEIVNIDDYIKYHGFSLNAEEYAIAVNEIISIYMEDKQND